MHCSDTVSASIGSPPRSHYEPPLSQLRDILTSASDIEHSSNDHIDVKDLSFRTGGGNGGGSTGAQVSTSAGPHEASSMNGDYETSRGATAHETDLELRLIRMRKFSEASSADLEHNNNSYKFKNYIKQRFSQDNHLDDKVGSSSGSNCSSAEKPVTSEAASKKRRISIHVDLDSTDVPDKRNGPLDMKIESHHERGTSNSNSTSSTAPATATNSHATNGRHPIHSFAVPIFACHTQGYYIPLNIDYETLLPFLGATDLLNKNFSQMPPLHPISINVNYAPLKPIGTPFVKPKIESVTNGW